MDAPGAMVEVVASTTPTTTPTSSLELRRGGKKTVTHDYRKTLLLRYMCGSIGEYSTAYMLCVCLQHFVM